jgi:serine protease Do
VFKLERIQGVVAQDFTPNSPAERAGMRQGDVIVAVDGKPIQRVGQFQSVIAGYHPGDQVTLDVIRYGQPRQLHVTLSAAQTDTTQHVAQDDRPPAAPDAEGGKLGVAVGPMTADVARKYGYTGAGGLVVTDVQPFGPGGRAGLQPGMRITAVDGQAVSDVAAFRAAMARKHPGDIVSLQVQAGSTRSILNVRLPD